MLLMRLLGIFDDDAVHARVDRWLDGRFPGGVVEVQLEQRDSDVTMTGPDVVDHGQIAARLAAGVDEHEDQTDEQEPDVDQIFRLVPPREPADEPESAQEPEPEPERELDEYAELRAAFVSSLTDVDDAGHDELMQALKADDVEFFAVLGQLTDQGLVADSGTRLRLVRG